jgi:hypothetical protein
MRKEPVTVSASGIIEIEFFGSHLNLAGVGDFIESVICIEWTNALCCESF